jgi:hypothetical protein
MISASVTSKRVGWTSMVPYFYGRGVCTPAGETATVVYAEDIVKLVATSAKLSKNEKLVVQKIQVHWFP